MFTFYALAKAPLAEATALLNLTPVFVAILASFWLHEPMGKVVGLCLALSAIGVLLIFRSQMHGMGAGELAALLAALNSAMSMVSLRKMGKTESAEGIVTYFSFFGAFAMAVLGASTFQWPDSHGASLLILAGVSATVAQIAMTRAYALDRAARVGGMNYINIVISIAIGALVFHETPDWIGIAGMAVILISGAILVRNALRAPTEALG